MISFFHSLIGLLIPTAYADIWGTDQSQAVSDMFARIRAVLLSEEDIGGSDVAAWLIGRIVMFIVPLIGAAAVLMVLYAGLKMIWGRGNEESFTQAKTIITYAALGVVLGTIATVVIGFAVYFFTAAFQ